MDAVGRRGLGRRALGWRWRLAACAAVLLGSVSIASAQEIEPNEFIPAPDGTNINVGYLVYGDNTSYYTTSGHKVSDSGLQALIGVERFVHYDYIAGHPAGFQIIQDFGSESGGKVGGASIGSGFGAANTNLSAFFWPIADVAQKTYVVIAGFVYVPDGTYDKNANVNLAGASGGSFGWSGDVQLGIDKGFGEHFSFDASADGRFFGQTTAPIQPNVPIGVRTHHDADLRLQLWLNWAWNRALTTSIGYEGFVGGDTYFDNPLAGGARVRTGQSTEHRLRAAAGMFLSPQTQVLLEVNHDIDRSGGFSQGFGTTLRFLYIF